MLELRPNCEFFETHSTKRELVNSIKKGKR